MNNLGKMGEHEDENELVAEFEDRNSLFRKIVEDLISLSNVSYLQNSEQKKDRYRSALSMLFRQTKLVQRLVVYLRDLPRDKEWPDTGESLESENEFREIFKTMEDLVMDYDQKFDYNDLSDFSVVFSSSVTAKYLPDLFHSSREAITKNMTAR